MKDALKPYFNKIFQGHFPKKGMSDMDFVFYIMEWKRVSGDLREDLEDELVDEMFENENLVPLSIFCEKETLGEVPVDNDGHEPLEVFMNKAHGYLFYDSETGAIHQSGIGKVCNSIDQLELVNVR